MFVDAIQGGMRPNLVSPILPVGTNQQIASNWNFAFFTSGGGEPESELGSVRAIQMEFETTVRFWPSLGLTYRTITAPLERARDTSRSTSA